MRGNKRAKTLEFNGKQLTVNQWARELGIHPQTIRNRIRYGWTVERALTTKEELRAPYQPRIPKPQLLTFRRKTMTIEAWAEETGIPVSIIRSRISNNWTLFRALTQPTRSRDDMA